MAAQAAVLERLKVLPDRPGCYLFHGKDDEVLYVGKAVSLRSRVRSYFRRSAKHGIRIARLVDTTQRIDWIVVDSEVEALVLECNLIKQHRPPFNIRLRDDKSYPYIQLTREKFPRVLFARNPRRDGSKYHGPFASAWAVRDTLALLHRVFPLIPCGKSWSGEPVQRPCLYYHMGQCLAPCAGLSDAKEYKGVVERVERFLAGKTEDLVADMKREMDAAAEGLDFEQAAAIRDRIGSIEAVLQRQKVMSVESLDRDVVAVVKDERGAAIQLLFIRGGKLIGQRHFLMDGAADAAPGEAVQEFVKQYYAQVADLPREVLLPVEIEERAVVQQWLRSRRGAAVTVDVPRGGERLRLVEMAAANAEEALAAFRQELERKDEWAAQAAEQLAETLELPNVPSRIEGFDISNIQGTAPVGSMVVFEGGAPAKAEYRRFKVRYHPESPDDFAMMHEVLTRRLRAYIDGQEKFATPADLIVIDGGRGQLTAALRARDDLGLTVPMVGLAKRHELILRPAEVAPPPNKKGADAPYHYDRKRRSAYEFETLELPLSAPALMLLRQLRDEAHRFALSYHRKVRSKRTQGSALDEVPGIGPRRRRMLLRTFGSAEAIRRASVDEIAAVPTMTRRLAEAVHDALAQP